MAFFLPVKVAEKFPNLEHYKCHHSPVRTVARINFMNLRKLISLDLANNKISTIELDSFVDLVNLESLVLYANELTSIQAELLSYNHALKRLLLFSNKIQFIDENAFENKPNLTYVNLSNNKCIKSDYDKDPMEPFLRENLLNLKRDLKANCGRGARQINANLNFQQFPFNQVQPWYFTKLRN